MKMGGCWLLEVDIRKFFDSLDHHHLREILQKRMRDGVLTRLIGKWLNAGVLEEGRYSQPEAGSPQGGVISPILANVYLHEVLDTWFERDVKPRLVGRAFLVRYADDFVIGFEHEIDARRVLAVLPKRFEKYGLTIHPDKTRLVDFRKPGPGDGPLSGTFDLLGFTHYWAKSRKGTWVVKRKTAKDRFSRAVKAIDAWCRTYRHLPMTEQHHILSMKLRGHCAYYGITGNADALDRFRQRVQRVWHKWLNRRSQRRSMNWERFSLWMKRFPLPKPRCVHSVVRPAANPSG
jgi:group II intron reverse transcriptase/maturase